MKNIKIAVLTKNKKYGEALSRGLAEERTGIEITCIDSTKGADYDILLTDLESLSGPQILVLSDENAPEANLVDRCFSVAKIMNIILDKFIENNGRLFLPQKSKDTVVIGVVGETGGAGATSVAITIGRILSLQEKNVIYLNFSDNDDYVIYSECSFESIKSIRELLYRINEGQRINLSSFLTKDSYGLNMMKPDCKICISDTEVLLRFLSEEAQMDYIVVDTGRKKDHIENCHHLIIISNFNDSRSKNNDGAICNHTITEGKNHIREDRETFGKKDHDVVISMDGGFAIDIKRLVLEKLGL